jgi:hypothetical protein
MSQKMYEAKFIPAAGGLPITVTIPASDHVQAKKMLEQQYGPIKTWYKSPQQTH